MYSQTQYEVLLTPTDAAVSDAGQAGIVWAPGLVPHIIRGFSVMIMSGGADLAAPIQLQHRNLTSGSTASNIATINLVATDNPGHVVYKENLNVEILPGHAVFANSTDTNSGPFYRASIYVEPRWERPGNNVNMRAST